MYNALKTEIAEWIGITKDALHVHVGLAVFFAAVILLRRSPASLVPWLVVFGLEVANELKDIFHWSHGRFFFDLGDAPKDLVNTMIWPTLLVIGFRVVERQRRQDDSKEPAPASS
jgi:hypothetical protein